MTQELYEILRELNTTVAKTSDQDDIKDILNDRYSIIINEVEDLQIMLMQESVITDLIYDLAYDIEELRGLARFIQWELDEEVLDIEIKLILESFGFYEFTEKTKLIVKELIRQNEINIIIQANSK